MDFLAETEIVDEWIQTADMMQALGKVKQKGNLFVSVLTAAELLQQYATMPEMAEKVNTILGEMDVLGIPAKYARYAVRPEFSGTEPRDIFQIILAKHGKMTVISRTKQFYNEFQIRCVEPEQVYNGSW